jgi:hypothetical protein
VYPAPGTRDRFPDEFGDERTFLRFLCFVCFRCFVLETV